MNNVYLFCGDSFLIKKNMAAFIASLKIQNEELNKTIFREMPGADEMIGVCSQVPFMADRRLVVLQDCNLLGAKGDAEEGNWFADYLPTLPDTTVLIMCYARSPDKRRVLYKLIGKLGQVHMYEDPEPQACVAFAIEQAAKEGAEISRQDAARLVELVGRDYFALDNEIGKLVIYAKGGKITSTHMKECVSKSLEVNVFELHKLLVNKKAAEAAALLEDLMSDSRPEALIGLIAYNFREMYKVKVMLDLTYSVVQIVKMLKARDFVVRNRALECKRFSQEEIKTGLVRLGDLDYAIKSGNEDAVCAMHAALFEIYKL